jgi:hypothetical protein
VVILILLLKTGKIKGKGESKGARTKFWVLRKNEVHGRGTRNERTEKQGRGARAEGREKARGKRKEERGKFRAVTSDW